ncbi:MAG: bifunctional [glutamine synthetase] adenylyltransferase/[glutamine synthetase]-adenylyl-L-tyrosine phosphorylase [Propionibacteriaceae bacterium]|jgi:glutamate-ammonia-ligase adenylyltransferase|nr:bifunctional [glutamine synthetase] adenylyltransferase/[glutamine synthetase]-adenylyl-L-tyrosine phosphorylase [Propionibacteriaceae bacterium]
MARFGSLAGKLARLGFNDLERAQKVVEAFDVTLEEEQLVSLVERVAAAPDPDQALGLLGSLHTIVPDLLAKLAADEELTALLFPILGLSVALGQHLVAHPELLQVLKGDLAPRTEDELRDELLSAIGADPHSPTPVADPKRADDLRYAYRKELLRIVARDLSADDPYEEIIGVTGDLANLADQTVEAALALARGEVPGWEQARIAVIALGKTGAEELNYVSDVDVLYVGEPALGPDGQPLTDSATAVAIAGKLAGALMRITSAHTPAGTIWPVDPNLRPEGKQGPLVRTLASHEAYYGKWAKDWEFQAMLKARPMAGDLQLGQAFVDMVWPKVWQVADDPNFVAEVQAMRKRVVSLLPPTEADWEIKLGAGGLRDVEFTVQLLQLVHGRADVRLRLRGTFTALEELITYGYISRGDGAELIRAYQFLRAIEHRVQLRHLRRTHLMPSQPSNQRWLARSLGFAEADELVSTWRNTTRRVLALHRHVFYSPLLEAVARIPSGEVRLTSEAAQVRLQALGYHDPQAALRHIQALSTGMSRQAEIQRQILPAMLGWFAAGPNPDYGLLAFRQVSEALGRTPWYLRALRDGDVTAEHFAKVLASSRYAVDLLLRNPQSADLLNDADGLIPRDREAVLNQMRTTAARQDDPADATKAIRAVRREELLRLAMGDLLGVLETEELSAALSELAGATVQATWEVAARDAELPPIAIIAMGRWGGRELSYASDADAMVVTPEDTDPEATAEVIAAIGRLRSLLAAPGPDPALTLDLDLRPEGKGGPMVRTLSSYRSYYERWSSTWEAQALLRASYGAGDVELAGELLALIDPIRYPAQGLSAAEVAQIRKLKARMEAERIPKGTDPTRNTKLGPGGLTDVEWVVQLLQLKHAGQEDPDSGLRQTTTLGPLRAATALGLIGEEDAAWLQVSWMMASQIRNAIMLLRGRASDTIPTQAGDLAAVASILGYRKGEASTFLEDYRRHSRLARQVMDKIFWEI